MNNAKKIDKKIDKKIACIGEGMVELTHREDGGMGLSYGGDTLNTAVYMSRLGLEVEYVTALGDDPYSSEMMNAWQSENARALCHPHGRSG